jgi:DNA-binding PadR family transcriptional regulator
MRHRHQEHEHRHRWHREEQPEGYGRGRMRGHHGRGRRGARPFDYGELRILVLALIGETPCHGYELMKSIQERMGGSYTPSPGVIYPTLSWLEDSGYTVAEAEDGGRKRYRITPEGKAFLEANHAAVEAMFARFNSGETAESSERGAATVMRGMYNLKVALRLRFKRGGVDDAAAQKIAEALDAAAKTIEQS